MNTTHFDFFNFIVSITKLTSNVGKTANFYGIQTRKTIHIDVFLLIHRLGQAQMVFSTPV